MVADASFESSVHFLTMNGFEDRRQHVLCLRQYVGVPESQDAKPVRAHERVTTSVIARLFDMLTAVELNDERGLQADEVADVGTERPLPAEFEPVQTSAA